MDDTTPSSLKPLVDSKVIGDVLGMFSPAAELTVQYGSKRVTNGHQLTPSEAADKPTVQFSFHGPSHDNLFTLVMVDPDAPDPSQPTLKEWLHWVVIDIPEGTDPSKGNEVVEYMGPKPPSGIHRYIFVLFQQKARIGKLTPLPEPRNNFNTQEFAAQHDLGLPVAAVYFTSQK